MSEPTATVHIDGAARGNPGPASYALVLRRPGVPDYEEAEPIGKATNNVAEYTALVKALERAAEFGVKQLDVFSDSELLVKQMNGEYRVKHPDLQTLYAAATKLRGKFERLTLTHVRRAQNADADRLGNEALDGKPRGRGGKVEFAIPSPAVVRTPTGVPEELEREAVALLNAVQSKWAAGATDPPAIEVWDRLWALLGEHRVLAKR